MKIIKYLTIIVITMFFVTVYAKDVWVPGYYKGDGTYVQPHYRTPPNKSFRDNYSSKPNINPYTGKKGTKTQPANKNYYSPRGYGSPLKSKKRW